jgi:hypothetical protein
MSFNLLNWLMLFGMVAVIIPPLIHLLNRRRYNVVDWGAMQFLLISDTKRRKLFIEELLLMLLRMGLIAVMVLALALPYAVSPLFGEVGLRQNRDVVLVFGGSASMEATDAHEAAKRWALQFLDELAPGDSVTILQAKKQVVPVLAEPTSDFDLARSAVEHLSPPGGGCDWPAAVRSAYRLLEKSRKPLRNIILLGDGQRSGWADDTTIGGWQTLAVDLPQDSDIKPTVSFLNFDPDRDERTVNWALTPLRAGRVSAYVRQDVEFRTDLLLYGRTTYLPPRSVRLELDGDPETARKLPFPSKSDVRKNQAAKEGKEKKLVVPLPPFKVRFKTPGSHLVTVIVRTKAGREVRQHHALEVLPLPVLIVDGDGTSTAEERRIDNLRLALDPRRLTSKEPPTAVLARVVPYDRFKPGMLNPPPDKRRPQRDPRVLVLANVPQLTKAQQRGITRFLESGGGVLVTLGDRVRGHVRHYNDALYRDGKGWLPARLERVGKARSIDEAVSPRLADFNHPTLELFRQESVGGLNDAYFLRWWVVTPAGAGKAGPRRKKTGARAKPAPENAAVVAAPLNNKAKDPWLVARDYRGGRVILCTVPLMNSRDNRDLSWDTNLLRNDIHAFAPLMHELVYFLAGNLSTGADKGNLRINYNLEPGQPLYYGVSSGEAEDRLTLALPGEPEKLLVYSGPRRPDVHRARLRPPPVVSRRAGRLLDFGGTYHTGVYTLRVPNKVDWLPPETAEFFDHVFAPRRQVYYTAHSDDPGEFDLTPTSAEDRDRVASYVPVNYETNGDELTTALIDQANTQELWWVFMLAVVVLLCAEVWMTRRIVKARA